MPRLLDCPATVVRGYRKRSRRTHLHHFTTPLTTPADLTDAKWDHGSSDGEIFAVIWNGAPAPKSEMKPMKGTLTEKNVWEIVNYLRSIGPAAAAAKAPAK